jgi:hypothetical protein
MFSKNELSEMPKNAHINHPNTHPTSILLVNVLCVCSRGM